MRSDIVQAGWAGIERSGEELAALEAHLSDDERRRAGRFYFDRDRVRFIGARGLLRRLVSVELGVRPRDVRFGYGAHGKPYLDGAHADSGLRFNVSHSDDRGLFVLARERELGADLEKVRPVRYGIQVARRFFAADECAALAAFEGEAWNEAFFRIWTRKEAFIKAVGDGLSFPLRDFSVSSAADAPARLLRVEGHGNAAERFWLAAVDAGPGFQAAIAVEGPPCPVERIDVDALAAESMP